MAEKEISREQINASSEEQQLGPTMIAGRVSSKAKAAAEKYEEKTGKSMRDIPKEINEISKTKGNNAKVIIDDDGTMNKEVEIDNEKEEK